MGLNITEAIERIATFENMQRHLEVVKGINGSTIIDDTWTINPTSIEAALNVIDEVGKEKKKIVLLGDINRLGEYEKEYHQKVGTMVSKRTFQTLITIGHKAEEIGKQAILDGFTGHVYMFSTTEGVQDILVKELDADSILLIKGPMKSRSMIELAQNLRLT